MNEHSLSIHLDSTAQQNDSNIRWIGPWEDLQALHGRGNRAWTEVGVVKILILTQGLYAWSISDRKLQGKHGQYDLSFH